MKSQQTLFFLLSLWLLPNCTINASDLETNIKAQRYINTHLEIAQHEAKRTGVLTSIKIAQAILETGYGESALAMEAHNHFGATCGKGWIGEIYYHTSAEYEGAKPKRVMRHTCFRKYTSSEQSFVDHSERLLSYSAYVEVQHLVRTKNTDYKVWANALKKDGYASDPNYNTKVIEIIERFKLYLYDEQPSQSEELNSNDVYQTLKVLRSRIDQSNLLIEEKEQRILSLNTKVSELTSNLDEQHASIEELKIQVIALEQALANQKELTTKLTIELEQVKKTQQTIIKSDPFAAYINPDGSSKQQVFVFPVYHKDANDQFYVNNKKAVAWSKEYDLIGLASNHDIPLTDLIKYNDLENLDISQLSEGYYLYLEPKSNSSKNVESNFHQVKVGETMHSISQLYGIKLAKLLQRNNLKANEEPLVNEFISLNKSGEKPKTKQHSSTTSSFDGGGTGF